MKITAQLTDTAILRELGARLAATRLERNLTQAALAEQAGVSKRTLERLESGEVATQLSGFVRVCRALDLAERLDLLVPEPVPSPLAQMKLQGRQRQRASGKRAAGTRGAADGPGTWTWGQPE
ncbi:helix-turn-helix transcriptional regulator [uncultured Thiodictyon sp.]|jgi:transcriptional regulator with XRE-family HTH domain|uniref:helix-turn-helix domain-containing protein n=1 Tax=uncultured Thiodictyon sp. TaxID=1846217 RepID=UPI0025E25CB5|nr:helix-turn-helix transcriptional regulator [uncultured Thiodictyon sp.]